MKKRKISLSLLIVDILALYISFFLSLFFRFEVNISTTYMNRFYSIGYIFIFIKIFSFNIFDMYRIYWPSSSIKDAFTIIYVSLISNSIILIFIYFNRIFPLSIVAITTLLDIFFIGITRFLFLYNKNRFYDIKWDEYVSNYSSQKKIMIVGAGDAGILVINELKKHPHMGNAVVFIDDDLKKYGMTINGIPVEGQVKDIPDQVFKYGIDEIIVAIPSINSQDHKRILNICTSTNKKVKVVPGIYELIDRKIDLKQIREVRIEDLLGREQVKLDQDLLKTMLEDKILLVTGGGGSIGAEISRQIAKYSPKQLIILDIYENNAYEIQMELKRKYPDLNLLVLIESIRDKQSIDRVFEKYSPEIVFHAAAHKHVPLMEDNYLSAIKNNIFGSKNVFDAADKYRVKKLVNISTDKAVNPTNIMGATKRVIEIMLQTMNKISKTDFVAVRFGNVLGSNGSVIPLFQKQIKEGGPVTVTHKNIIRYFMTIPEACQLVLQAGSIAKGGEIYILDMGEPVKIVDLAENLIKLSGYIPYEEIDIQFTGLRPGEKLYEELLLDKSNSKKTEFNNIYIEKPSEINDEIFKKELMILEDLVETGQKSDIIRSLKTIVPTFNHRSNN